ncbi:hypothetical protein BIV24_17760 [Streptomyces colonosanans]|uniref:Transposase n=1 Tax=Streptomyces colonosanans TaxID=1428652 RepID=A0A1S2P9C4_9ACTN|nr:hypothetical protein BIV24_17760 [Streptomyces colonosanans]
MVAYVATLDVPRHVVDYLSRLLATRRRQIGTPRSDRSSRRCWCCAGSGCVHCLVRDTGISQATGYRYLHEGIDALAGQAPDLHEVLVPVVGRKA